MGSDKPETSSLAAGTSRISYMVALSRGRAVRSSSETFVPAQLSSRAGVCIDDLPEDSTESVHGSLVATAAVVLRIGTGILGFAKLPAVVAIIEEG